MVAAGPVRSVWAVSEPTDPNLAGPEPSDADLAGPEPTDPKLAGPEPTGPAEEGSGPGDDLLPEPAEPAGLDRWAARIDWPDGAAEAATREHLATRAKPPGALGRLEELAVWMAGTQGTGPPREPQRVRLVVFAADHGISAAGVSADPPGTTARRVVATRAGAAVSTIVADVVGAGVRIVDMGVDWAAATDLASEPSSEPGPDRFGEVSARIDTTDALSPEQTLAAIEAGARIADEEIDSGADLLIAGDVGIASTTPAAVVVAVMTDTEPVKVVGRGSGIDDEAWTRKVAAIRDARRRGMPHRDDMVALLGSVGGADLAAITGFLLQAAARRTPVLLDGLVVGAAALVAREAAPAAIRWWQAAQRATEPAHALALDQLTLEPLLDLRLAIGEGVGALLAVPLLRAAARTAAELGDATPVAPDAATDPTADPVDDPATNPSDDPGPDPADGSADVGLDEGRLDQPGR